LAEELQPGDLVLLEGDLAAGKTTFTRGLVDGLKGSPADVSSPSFIVIQTYPCAAGRIGRLHHVDLYRIGGSVSDLRELGIEEILSDPTAVVAVEWPKDTLARWLPADSRVWRVRIATTDSDAREITIGPPD
jgi:tRNA threonylcarbamoyladenosine biosynthesis protein TsaE